MKNDLFTIGSITIHGYGLMIGIGCVVSMSCENRYLGAFLFSLGLFCIVRITWQSTGQTSGGWMSI